MEAQLTRIKQKIKYLQDEWRENYPDVFAFFSHQMVMNPPLSGEKLLEFEQTYQLRLPEGYRRFLLEIGNGGAGPYWGLLPLERWTLAFEDPDWMQGGFRIDKVAHLLNECTARPLPGKNYGIMPEDEWNCSLEGTLTICDQGCNYSTLLVVRGKEYGRICYTGMMGEPYFMPDADFLSWYERWLDEILLRRTDEWFGGAGWMTEDKGSPDMQPLDFDEFLERKRVSAENSRKIAELEKPEQKNGIQATFYW